MQPCSSRWRSSHWGSSQWGFLLLALIATLLVPDGALAAPFLNAPASATAGSPVTIQVTGNGNPREFVTIVPKGTAEGQYREYFYLENREKVLMMPAQPGDYELRLLDAGSPYKTLVARPIRVTAANATVNGPSSAAAGSEIAVSWTGPNNERDYVGLGVPGGSAYLTYEYTRKGSPIKLTVPDKPGTYEIRYFLGVGNTIIARQTLTVTAVSASVANRRMRASLSASCARPWRTAAARRPFSVAGFSFEIFPLCRARASRPSVAPSSASIWMAVEDADGRTRPRTASTSSTSEAAVYGRRPRAAATAPHARGS